MWWLGNVILLVVVAPVLVALLNRVLAALERIRAAADDTLGAGVALIGERGFDRGKELGASRNNSNVQTTWR